MTTRQKNGLWISVSAGLIVAATIWIVKEAIVVPYDVKAAKNSINKLEIKTDSLCKTKVDKEVLELKLAPVVEDITEIKTDLKEIRNDVKLLIRRGK